MRTASIVFGFFSVLSLAACSGAPASNDTGASEEDVTSASASFFLSTGPGLTDGIAVKAVNASTTKCADGTRAGVCTIAQLDFGSLSLSDALQKDASNAFFAGHALVKGKLGTANGAPVLKVSEVWMGQTSADVSNLVGQFYQVTKTAACSRVAGAECPEGTEKLLNKTSTTDIGALDLSTLGASKDVLDAALAAEATGDLLVAGLDRGVVGTMMALVANEVYLKLGTGHTTGAGEGELCGGIAGIACADGLVCDMGGKNFPDASGTCTKPANHGAGEGDLCGGIAGIQCADGLVCDMGGKNFPDASGTCKKADCRQSGCADGSQCSMCFGSFACIPNGAQC